MTNNETAAVPSTADRIARYKAAYAALHGATVVVVWTGEKFRVHTPGERPAYDIHFDGDELDAISIRMSDKVRDLVAAQTAAANAPGDIFEALGLAKSASEEGGR